MSLRVAFTGLATAGKTTAANFLIEKYGATKVAWADPVKLEVFQYLDKVRNDFVNPTKHLLEGMPNIFSLPLPPLFGINDQMRDNMLEWVNANKKWLRPMLQWWGTDYRRGQDKEYWIKQGLAIIDRTKGNLTIDDSRFANEGQALRERGFAIVQIDRPGLVPMEHASEKLEILPDFTVQNNGTIYQLGQQLEIILDVIADINETQALANAS